MGKPLAFSVETGASVAGGGSTAALPSSGIIIPTADSCSATLLCGCRHTRRDWSSIFILTEGTAADDFSGITRPLQHHSLVWSFSRSSSDLQLLWLSLHRLGRKSHLSLPQERTWESGFPAGDELGCVHNAACDPSDSISLQETAKNSTASWQSIPSGKAASLLIPPEAGWLSLIRVHRHNAGLPQMKAGTFRQLCDRRSEANPCSFLSQGWNPQSKQPVGSRGGGQTHPLTAFPHLLPNPSAVVAFPLELGKESSTLRSLSYHGKCCWWKPGRALPAQAGCKECNAMERFETTSSQGCESSSHLSGAFRGLSSFCPTGH